MSLSRLFYMRLRIYSSSDGSLCIGRWIPRPWFAPFRAGYFRLRRFVCSRSH